MEANNRKYTDNKSTWNGWYGSTLSPIEKNTVTILSLLYIITIRRCSFSDCSSFNGVAGVRK